MTAQFHLLSFEGGDRYSLAGGIGSRVFGLAHALADLGFDTHLWFVGDPTLPGHEDLGHLHVHRWCQWISRHHLAGVYDGEQAKVSDYSRSLPPVLLREIKKTVAAGTPCVVIAEEWHTVGAVVHLDHLLRESQIRAPVSILWNANNTFGFHGIDWRALQNAALITTVSRYMKQIMKPLGINATVIPNGLSPDAFGEVEEANAARMRALLNGRTLLTKVARFDPDKCWLSTMEIINSLKRDNARPLLIARGGIEAHGEEVLSHARELGLRVAEVTPKAVGVAELLDELASIGETDIAHIRSHLDWPTRRLLFRESSAVLANSGHEPFGLVGLETMAVGGVACTGSSGEDYAVSGHNALVLETAEPTEFVALFRHLREQPKQEQSLREAARTTARNYAWPSVIRRALFPRAQLGLAAGQVCLPESSADARCA